MAGGGRKQLRLLVSVPGLNLNAADPASGRTALHAAVERRQPAVLRELIAAGAGGRLDLEARDGQGVSAALLAARTPGGGDALRELLAAGAGAWGAPRLALLVLVALLAGLPFALFGPIAGCLQPCSPAS